MTTSQLQSNYSFTEKKRIRKDFGKRRSILEVPFLLAIQVDSYREFLQADIDPAKREDRGLHAALKSVFPIVSYNGYAALEYVGYKLGDQPTHYALEGSIATTCSCSSHAWERCFSHRVMFALERPSTTPRMWPVSASTKVDIHGSTRHH